MSFSSGSFTFLGKDVQGVLGLNKCAEASVFCRQISYYTEVVQLLVLKDVLVNFSLNGFCFFYIFQTKQI